MAQRWGGDTWVEGSCLLPVPRRASLQLHSSFPSAQWPMSHCRLSSRSVFLLSLGMCMHVRARDLCCNQQRHSGLWIHLLFLTSWCYPFSLFLSLSISHLPHLSFSWSVSLFPSVSSFSFYFQLLTLLISVALFFKVIFPYYLTIFSCFLS